MDNGFHDFREPWAAIQEPPDRYTSGKRRDWFRNHLARALGSFHFCLALFLLTVVTTLVVGVHLAANYSQRLPLFDLNISWGFFAGIFRHPGLLWAGVPYAFTVILILLAHEMGHYLMCRYYRLDVTYPYFFPAPTLIGTFGAFIRIRSPLATREELFDVGIAGPIAGFVVTIPALIVGVLNSRTMLAPVPSNTIMLGHPWAVNLLARTFHPGIAITRLELSPVGCAAWVGLFLTALNLLPMGQLDGGHIVYAVFGKRHRYVSLALFVALVPLGILLWGGWIFWAVLMLILGLRHPVPLIPPDQPLDRRRKALAAAALLMFALSFTLAPLTVS